MAAAVAGGKVSADGVLKSHGRAAACTACTSALRAEIVAASATVARRTFTVSPSPRVLIVALARLLLLSA